METTNDPLIYTHKEQLRVPAPCQRVEVDWRERWAWMIYSILFWVSVRHGSTFALVYLSTRNEAAKRRLSKGSIYPAWTWMKYLPDKLVLEGSSRRDEAGQAREIKQTRSKKRDQPSQREADPLYETQWLSPLFKNVCPPEYLRHSLAMHFAGCWRGWVYTRAV